MILQVNDVNFEILEVLRFHRKSIAYKTTKRNFWVISCRLAGESTFYSGEQEIYAAPYYYTVLPPNLEYAQRSSDEEIICVHFTADCPTMGEIRSVYSSSPVLQQQFIDLYEIWQRKEGGHLLQCKSIIYGILNEFRRTREHSDMFLLSPATEYILAHFNECDFSLNTAISKAAISPAYFRRLFKECYGKTPVQWVNELRIDYAKSLLRGRNHTISEVAQMSGFSNDKYFHTVFKKTVKFSPSKWMMKK